MRALSLFLGLGPSLFAAQAAVHLSFDGRDVAVWKPAGSAPAARFPVVVFSHGYGGCNTQSVFLMEALANAGYLVVAPNHRDARCGSARGKGLAGWKPEAPFRKEADWSDATYKDRGRDIHSLLDWILSGRTFEGVPVDRDRVGIAGHSLGGYTALGVAGAWPSWKDSRIKAVLALSAYCAPFTLKGDLPHLNVPVMYQSGTLDLGVSPTIRRFQGAYDVSSSPKYYVEFKGAGHFAWTNLNPRFQETIARYSVAFFDRYVKGVSNPDPLAALTGKPLPAKVSYLRAQPGPTAAGN